MISQPLLLIFTLLAMVSFVLCLAKVERTKNFFKYLPAPLWCYFIPTLISTAGWIPSDSPVYNQMSRALLPPCLILLLIGTDLPSIARLSRKSLAAMFAGSFGILAGGTVTFLIASRGQQTKSWGMLNANQSELWKGWGCLSASWTGGSANMIAVKEILKTPETLFSNLIIVDAIVAYSWMAFLVFLSKYQEAVNRKLCIEESQNNPLFSAPLIPTENRAGVSEAIAPQDSILARLSNQAGRIILLLTFAFLLGHFCWLLSNPLPTVGTVLNRLTWTVILATAIPLALSMTRVKKLENLGANQTGNFLLYLLLTSIGARANLSALLAAPGFVFLGMLWVFIHGTTLFFFGKIFKIPLALLATASQANVGGTISTPLVASVYRKDLAPVGIVLAVLGNIYGTAFGLCFSEICRRCANLL